MHAIVRKDESRDDWRCGGCRLHDLRKVHAAQHAHDFGKELAARLFFVVCGGNGTEWCEEENALRR